MRWAWASACCAAAAAVVLGFPSASAGGEPPNRNDPCSSAGKNTCGTLGVGYYQTYRYGIRWFGDYRGAIPGVQHTFCIDLRYWYPSADYDWVELTGALENRDGEPVSAERQRRIAYAVWAYGQSGDRDQQAAVMLYVHALMGDARSGEVDPAALSPRVVTLYERVARDAARYHGPYRIDVALAATSATIRVLSAEGNAVPDVQLRVNAGGARSQLRTNAAGVGQLDLKPATATTTGLVVDTGPLPSTLPKIFRPARNPAAANAQRLAVPDSQTLTVTIRRPFSKRQIGVTTVASPKTVLAGTPVTDRITITGALSTWAAKVTVNAYGPFSTQSGVRCDGTPAYTATIDARGSGVVTTRPIAFLGPGWYTFQLVVPGDASHVGVTTRCGEASETVRVEVQPRITTSASAQRVAAGESVFDRVTVLGLNGQRARINVALYGPFASRAALACTGTPAWTGTVEAAVDGEHQTVAATLRAAGYYTYRASIAAEGFVRAVEAPCGEPAETFVVVGQPVIKTQVSTQSSRVGATITDTVVVSGLGRLSVPVRVELWGPFASRAQIRCEGKPYWVGSFVAKGDGRYTTAPVRIDRAGYYTYRESIAAAGSTVGAVVTPCGDAAETTLARAQPRITTSVSSEVVRRGGSVFDRISVQGLGKTPATATVELYGPFPTRAAMRCSGDPYWSGQVALAGDGEVRSGGTTIDNAGFYTYRVRIAGSNLVAATAHECALLAETALAAPLIATGRGDVRTAAQTLRPSVVAPTRVRVRSLGIDAPVASVGIDVENEIVAAPDDIRRTGWWRDGAAPGDRGGAVLVVGHVDRAKVGPGAFFALHRAVPGTQVELAAGGRTYRYRVISVRNYPKTALPNEIYSRRGRPRLVLVTCGGPFDASAGRYRDNVVVVAVPT